MQRSNHPLLSKQSLTNLAALGNNAVLLSDVIVSLPWESISPPVLWGPLFSARLQRMVSEITLKQSNSPLYLPHPNTAQSLTHTLSQLSKGSLIFSCLFMKTPALRLLKQSAAESSKQLLEFWIKDHGETLLWRSLSSISFICEDTKYLPNVLSVLFRVNDRLQYQASIFHQVLNTHE